LVKWIHTTRRVYSTKTWYF